MAFDHVQHQLVLVEHAGHAQQYVPSAFGTQYADKTLLIRVEHGMQCFEIAAHTFLHARGLRWRRFKQCGNLFCDDLAHGQIVVGDHVETTLGFRHVFGGT